MALRYARFDTQRSLAKPFFLTGFAERTYDLII